MALGDGGKIAGLPRNAVIAGAAALVLGVAWFWWRSRKAGSSGGAGTAAAPVPADGGGPTGIPGTAGSMTDNFYITLNEQQGPSPKHGKPGHKHPHPKSDHDKDDKPRPKPQAPVWTIPGRPRIGGPPRRVT